MRGINKIKSNKTNRKKRLRLRRNPNLEEIKNDPLPNLPIDLVAEIFCRLPVKLLVQLRCMCESWNSLISDRSFTRKHLSISTTRRLHCTKYRSQPHELIENSYPLDSVLSTKFTPHRLPYNNIAASCDGILCLFDKPKACVALWNPSIRKFKELPPFENLQIPIPNTKVYMTFGIGYDQVSDNYKVVGLYYIESKLPDTTKVKVHTLGTNFWKSSESFPFGAVFDEQSGTNVKGTLNWMAHTEWPRNGPIFILSFDLGNDSYQKLLPPQHADISPDYFTLHVLKDCLCLISRNNVWLMKEYGIHDSWTKLLSVSFPQDPTKSYSLTNALCVFDDHRLLLEIQDEWTTKFVLYDLSNDTFKFTRFKNNLKLSLETLISPCS